MNWLLDVRPTSLYELPTNRQMKLLAETAIFYLEDIPRDPSTPRRQEQLALIKEIDLPNHEKFDLVETEWTKSRRHKPKKPEEQKYWREVFFGGMKAELDQLPAEDLDKPYSAPYPLSECGLTKTPYIRMRSHQRHSGSTRFMVFVECIALHLFDGDLRMIYTPVAIFRSSKQPALMECFFSRLCQSYIWLGGLNIFVAGVSDQSSKELAGEAEWAAYSTINFDEVDRNLAYSKSKLDLLVFASGQAARDKAKKELEKVEGEFKAKRKALRKDLAALVRKTVAETGESLKMAVQNQKALEEISMLERLLEIDAEMRRLAAESDAK